ncbi:hypothetical protein HMPREF3226_00827 [Prevotella corporis]|uniref:Uncharacterized protein n=1 Tax=Prevotella corporis TaxID=28128 RepID=A0A133QF53_9BACT|nr:hypothetical protein HMPREF3226_00827 [Prevotella corporis]
MDNIVPISWSYAWNCTCCFCCWQNLHEPFADESLAMILQKLTFCDAITHLLRCESSPFKMNHLSH